MVRGTGIWFVSNNIYILQCAFLMYGTMGTYVEIVVKLLHHYLHLSNASTV